MEQTFNLHATVVAVQQALFAVTCHMLFDFAMHGLVLALALGVTGFFLNMKGNRYGKPLMNVCRRLSIFCAVLSSPGWLTLAIQHHLPPTGVYNVNSIGFIIFWSMVCVHGVAEEMNYWFWVKKDPVDNSQQYASTSAK